MHLVRGRKPAGQPGFFITKIDNEKYIRTGQTLAPPQITRPQIPTSITVGAKKKTKKHIDATRPQIPNPSCHPCHTKNVQVPVAVHHQECQSPKSHPSVTLLKSPQQAARRGFCPKASSSSWRRQRPAGIAWATSCPSSSCSSCSSCPCRRRRVGVHEGEGGDGSLDSTRVVVVDEGEGARGANMADMGSSTNTQSSSSSSSSMSSSAVGSGVTGWTNPSTHIRR